MVSSSLSSSICSLRLFFLLPRSINSINLFTTSLWVISASCASKNCIYDRKTLEIASVADPWHFGTDPDPWIRTVPLFNGSGCRSGTLVVSFCASSAFLNLLRKDLGHTKPVIFPL
jgi:hypothetical protein